MFTPEKVAASLLLLIIVIGGLAASTYILPFMEKLVEKAKKIRRRRK